MNLKRLSGAALFCAMLAYRPAIAFAFAEDICFPQGGGTPTNCATIPPECLPIGTTSLACRTAAAKTLIAEANKAEGVRSTVHADATHVLAQAIGFSAEDAYWIAAYDEVTDYGSFEPTDEIGAPFGGGAFKTASLDGFVRTNTKSGGLLFHFHAPYNGGATTPPAGIDGLHPAVSDPKSEVFLAHVRAWATGETGSTRVLCTAGLTVAGVNGDYATGTSCFDPPAPVKGSLTAFGSVAVPLDLQTGAQPISGTSIATEFDNLVGGAATRSSDARIGIYLHSLADRISHRACGGGSVLSGPDATTGWNEDMTATECATGYHTLYHIWETGVDFNLVPSSHRTTLAALSLIYDELVSFATARGVAKAGAGDAATKDAIVSSIATALQTPAAVDRLHAIASVACQNKLEPFPGMPACETSGTGGAGGVSGVGGNGGVGGSGVGGVGGAKATGGSSSSGSSSDGGCNLGPRGRGDWRFLTVALLGVGVGLRRRRGR